MQWESWRQPQFMHLIKEFKIFRMRWSGNVTHLLQCVRFDFTHRCVKCSVFPMEFTSRTATINACRLLGTCSDSKNSAFRAKQHSWSLFTFVRVRFFHILLLLYVFVIDIILTIQYKHNNKQSINNKLLWWHVAIYLTLEDDNVSYSILQLA